MSKKVYGLTTATLSTLFSKPSRLTSKHDCFNVKAFPWKSTPPGLDPNNDFRATFIAGKKSLGKFAVDRNRAERRVKASVSAVFPSKALKGHDYIVYLQPPAVTTKWPDLQSQVEQAASKIRSLNVKRSSPRIPTHKPRTPVV